MSIIGCSNDVSTARCSSTSVLSEDSFNYDSTDYAVTVLFVRSDGRFEFTVDADITTETAALTLVVGSTSLVLADAETSTTRGRVWDSSGVFLTAGTAIDVKLTAATTNTAPTAADNRVTASAGTAYAFTADDFGFDDDDADDTLASVRIVTRPVAGTLALDGTTVMANQVVPKADIAAAALTFTPASGASGTGYASFTFKVNDGTVDSAITYTMTVNVRANTAATGAPAITGPAQVGMVLTASPGTIADADGLTAAPGIIVDVDGQTGVSYSYQWIQVNGTDEMDSPGGTFSTYTPVEDDAGKTLKVRASFTDDAGFAEQRTSAPTATVTVPCAAPVFGDRRRIWHAMLTVGEYNRFGSTYQGYHYTVPAGALDDPTFTIGTNDYEFSTILVHLPSGALAVSLSAELTALELAALRLNVCEMVYDFSDRGGTVRTYSWDGSLDWSSVGSRTLYLSLSANKMATGRPVITGTAKVGQELSVDLTRIADADGLTGVTYNYQWVRVDADGTSDPVDITDATGDTYTLTAADVGKQVKVKVSFTDNLGGKEDLESEAFPLPTSVNNAATGAPAITGTAQVGMVLTASPGTIADADGLTGVSYSYQWIQVDGADEMDIDGATSSTYTLMEDDAGKTFKVRASFTDDAGYAEQRISDAYPASETVNAAPSFTSPAAFDAAENQTAVGTVQASDSDDGDSVTGYAIQDGADESKFSIVAASGVLTFVSAPNFEAATDADGDNDYVVVVRATSGTGARVKTADQTITVTVTDANDPATGTPTISGTATVGQVLTASTTGIADADGLTGVTYTYQWVRVDADGTSNPTDIAGEIAATYNLTADDLGKKVKVEVSFTDDFGTDEQRTSAPTATVTAPGLITAPGVTGVTVTSKPAEGNTYTRGRGHRIHRGVHRPGDGDRYAEVRVRAGRGDAAGRLRARLGQRCVGVRPDGAGRRRRSRRHLVECERARPRRRDHHEDGRDDGRGPDPCRAGCAGGAPRGRRPAVAGLGVGGGDGAGAELRRVARSGLDAIGERVYGDGDGRIHHDEPGGDGGGGDR